MSDRALALRPIDVAERWQCSEKHVRNLHARGQLRGFRAGGKLLRFRLADVEDFECASSDSVEAGPPSGGKAESGTAARLVRALT